MICRDCILKVHRDHQYDLATEIFPQLKDMLIASIKPAKHQLASVNKALECLNTLHGELTNQRQALETKIKARIRLIHEALEARQEELIAKLDQITRQKLKNAAAQQDQLDKVATRLKSCCGFVQESLRTGTQVEILAMVKSFVQQVQDVTSAFKPESLFLEEKADLEFSISEAQLIQTCRHFGQLTTHPVHHSECHAEGTGLRVAMVGETATATVYVVDRKGREYQRPVKVSCNLVSSDGSSHVRSDVNRIKDSQYEISYHPQYRGQHYLHIQVEDKHISGSPFPVVVLPTTPSYIIRNVNGPWGLALSNYGELIVVEKSGHSVSRFTDNGDNKRSFSSHGSDPDQLDWPCGVALSATGEILVCDENNHRIHIFSSNGKSLNCVGTKGNGPLEFCFPVSIAIHPHSNKIYVAEGGNHRIQILNDDFTFSSSFGSQGSGSGQFHRPLDISFDSTGNVYVADTDNHRVQVFTANGKYIRQFGKKGIGEGELYQPGGIAIESDIIYISERLNHRISLFSREGEFLRFYGAEFWNPTGIAISNNGIIYVSSFSNDYVKVF